tara:strand:- start:1740 stop:2021 length:282 start_codon:yes stop_codon:yes gene_type:complete
MDYENKSHKLPKHTCFCNRQFKDGQDPIYTQFKNLKKVKEKINHRKYPNQHKIIDFGFKFGKKVAMGDKEKKPPKHGKIKMKSYAELDSWTKL